MLLFFFFWLKVQFTFESTSIMKYRKVFAKMKLIVLVKLMLLLKVVISSTPRFEDHQLKYFFNIVKDRSQRSGHAFRLPHANAKSKGNLIDGSNKWQWYPKINLYRIPYTISNNFPLSKKDKLKNNIKKANKMFTVSKTKIRFVPKQNLDAQWKK